MKKQKISFEKDEQLSTEAEDKIRKILAENGVKSEADFDFVKDIGRITIESEDEKLLNDILTSVSKHFNEKQDNFKLDTEGFKVEEEKKE